jgi:hypothetical protein
MQLKMYVRFILWILGKVFGVFRYVPLLFRAWCILVRTDFSTSLSAYTIMTIVSTAMSALTGFIIDGAPVREKYIWPGFIVTTIIYLLVIIAALYQVFLEEYEKSFTILKDKQSGE